MSKQQSLVLITTDCLRADHVGFSGYNRPTTPFLDSLARKSLIFSNAIVGGAPTYYSFPAIMASRYPLALGRDVIGLAPGETTLASVLQDSGYATAAFCAGNPYLSQEFGYDHGFDVFRDFLDNNCGTMASPDLVHQNKLTWRKRVNHSVETVSRKWKISTAVYEELYFQYCQRLGTGPADSLQTLRRFPAADMIVDHARAWLASVGRAPFFLWLHFMDPHAPYYPTQEGLALMGDRDVTPSRARYLNSYWNRSDLSPSRLTRHREDVLALYDSGIRWVDTQLVRLIEALRQFQQWDTCVFVFTADHGEEFLEHQGRYHLPSKVTEEIIRVPLLVRVPGKSAQVVKTPFSHLHLAPTLVDILNLGPSGFPAKSLWPRLEKGTDDSEAVAITECVGCCTNPFRIEARTGARVLAVRQSRYKLVLNFDSAVEQFFDLEADPGELYPLPAHIDKPARGRLSEIARQHLARPLPPQYPRLRLRSRLRDLRLKFAQTAKQFVPAYG